MVRKTALNSNYVRYVFVLLLSAIWVFLAFAVASPADVFNFNFDKLAQDFTKGNGINISLAVLLVVDTFILIFLNIPMKKSIKLFLNTKLGVRTAILSLFFYCIIVVLCFFNKTMTDHYSMPIMILASILLLFGRSLTYHYCEDRK